MWDQWAEAEQIVRDWLFVGTSVIPNEEAAGLLFGAGLVVADHLFGVAKRILP